MAAPLKNLTILLNNLNFRSVYRLTNVGVRCRTRPLQPRVIRALCTDEGSDKQKQTHRSQKLGLAKPDRKKRAAPATQDEAQKVKASEDDLDPQLEAAANEVAKSLGGDTQKTSSDLLQKLRQHVSLTNAQKDGKSPPKESLALGLFKGIKVERRRRGKPRGATGEDTAADIDTVGPPRMDRGEVSSRSVIGQMARRTPQANRQPFKDIKLYDGPALGIFTKKTTETTEVVQKKEPTLFDIIEEEEFQKRTQLPPHNAFEEMIKWTKEGKLRKFPIDNEYGMEEEARVGFHEHVFLEHLIEDFPKKGPLRHFMELVVVGLSQNPYLTVRQKEEHVEWFREYFQDKKQIIEEMIETEHTPQQLEGS